MLTLLNHRSFIYTVVLFLFIKSILLLFGMEHFFHVEEIYRALIAKSILEGPPFRLFDLQVDTYSGGSLVVGLLLVPLFKLFDQSLFAMKLVPLLFSLLMVVGLYVFCKKYLNEKTAVIACLLFTFSPPLVTKYLFFCMGFNTESILFSLLFMIVFFKIFYEGKQHFFWYLLLGWISGFGIWFNYTAAIVVLNGMVFWFVFDRLFFVRREFFIFAAGFFIGFSPWIYSHIFYHLSGAPLNTRKLLPSLSLQGLHAAWKKLTGLPGAFSNIYLFNFHYSHLYKAVHYCYCLFAACGVVFVALRTRRSMAQISTALFSHGKGNTVISLKQCGELFIFAYFIMFILAYTLSGFAVADFMDYFGYRYLIPLYFLITILIALFIAGIPHQTISGVLTILLIGAGIVGNLQYVGFRNNLFGFHPLDDRYCQYETLTNKKISRFVAEGDFDRCLVFSKTLPEQYLGQFYFGLGELSGGLFIPAPDRYHALLQAIDERFRRMFLVGSARSIILLRGDIDESIAFINAMEECDRDRFYRMLGIGIGFRNMKSPEKAVALMRQIEEKHRAKAYEGLGYFYGFCAPLYRPDIAQCIKLLRSIDPAYGDAFSLSFASLGRYFVQQGYTLHDCFQAIQQSSDECKPYLYWALGVHYLRDRNGFDSFQKVIKRIEPAYRLFFYEGMGYGIQDDQWLFSGLVAKRIKRVYFQDTPSRTAFYNGLEKSLYLQTVFALDGEQQRRLLKREGIYGG